MIPACIVFIPCSILLSSPAAIINRYAPYIIIPTATKPEKLIKKFNAPWALEIVPPIVSKLLLPHGFEIPNQPAKAI